MNAEQAIKDEANVMITGARLCMEKTDRENLRIAIAGLMMLVNLCTNLGLIRLEVHIQISIDHISCNTKPRLIK